MDCDATTLASGESTTCVLSAVAGDGGQRIDGSVSATTDGQPIEESFSGFYRGAPRVSAQPDPDPGTGEPDPGTGGPTPGDTGDKGTLPEPPSEVPTGDAVPRSGNDNDGLPIVLVVLTLALAGVFITGRAARRLPL